MGKRRGDEEVADLDQDAGKAGAGDDPDGAIGAVVFDMDGVVTDTAEAHFAAWGATFDDLLERRGQERDFSRRDYLEHVDGVPRLDGVRRFLESRGIDLPEGGADDEGTDSVQGLGNRKNRRFLEWLDAHRVPPFDDAVGLIEGLRRAGIGVGVFSASRNARRVLERAGVIEMFDAVVDGADAEKLGLAPKPDPAQLVATVERLGCDPASAAAVEDAVAGVKAGSAGRFGLVIGVNRQMDAAAHRHALRANGADLVTRDLCRLLLPGGGGFKTLDRLPLVWDRLADVRGRLGQRPPSVFLDYDGTLSPIVTDYRKAALPDETRAAIERLATRCPVAVISGRDLGDVRERVGLGNVIYAGSHGFDIAGPGGLQARPDDAQTFLGPIETADAELREALARIEWARIERKIFSIAVHFREVAEGGLPALEEGVERVVGRHEELRKGRGKKVLEIQPRTDWDKGRAVEWLLANTRLGEDDALPLYLGDDLTDEDAFAALSDSGLCIAVRGGRRATLADFALADPDDVCRFLEWLAERLDG